MTIEVETADPRRPVLRLAGEIDLACAEDVVAAGRGALAAAATGATLVVDLSAVEFADSSALNALVRLRNLAVESRVSPVLQDVPPVLASLLHVTGLDGFFTVTASDAASERLRHLRGSGCRRSPYWR